MHEMSIAMSIIDIVTEAARAEGAGQVDRVEIEVGELAGVMVESLSFCLELVASGTIADGARFEIISITAAAECLECGGSFRFETYGMACPFCKGYQVKIIGGDELQVAAINI